jgi:hypothetical protein
MRSSRTLAACRVRRRSSLAVGFLAVAAGAWSTVPAASAVSTAPAVAATPAASAVPVVPAAPAAATAPAVPIAGAVRAMQSPRATPRPLLAVSVSGSLFADEDMRRTYGGAPAVGLRIHVDDGVSAQYFLGVQFCSQRGDSYHGDPVFESSGNARLTVVPFELGLRTNPRRSHRQGFFVGAAGEYSRVWEKVRGADDQNPKAR